MNFKACYRHPMNQLALGFFIAALVCFGMFHIVPMWGRERGWVIWNLAVEIFSKLGRLRWKTDDALFIGLVLCWSLQMFAGPILTPFVCWNRLVCWVMTFVSLGAFVGNWWLWKTADDNAFLWILVSQALHFLGCLCIRSPKPEEFVPAPHPDA